MPRPAVKGPRKMTAPAGTYGEADAPPIVAHGKGDGAGGGKSVKIAGGTTGNRDKTSKPKMGKK